MRVIRSVARSTLRFWCRTGKAYGYFYQAMEGWGSRLNESEGLTARLPGGFRMMCDLRDHVQRHIFFQGVYEPIEAFLFHHLMKPGDTVIDAGANVGQYTLLASAALGTTGVVHSFEPVQKNYLRLQSHVDMNCCRNVRLNQLALWNEPTELRFGLPTSEENDGSYSIGAAANSTISATAIRLDDYIQQQSIGRVAVIKMDIEGAELGALQGMMDMLTRDKPFLLMEVNRAACLRLGYDPEQFWDLLVRQLGYKAWRIGMSASEWKLLPNAAELTQANVLFAANELPPDVRANWTLRRCLSWATQ